MDPALSSILNAATRSHGAALGSPDLGEIQQDDLRRLTRAWVAERTAPELLPYPEELMARVMDNIRKQIETIEEATARMDAGTSFGLVVIQTELERFKFLVRSLIRARIAKIDAHPLHVLSLHDPTILTNSQPSQDSQLQDLQEGAHSLLSEPEASYARTHAALLERHYTSSFLSSFPPKLRRMDDRAGAGGVGMIEGPDLDQAVFVRCLGVRKAGRSGEQTDVVHEDEEMEDVDGTGEAYGPVEAACGFATTGEDEEDAAVARNYRGEKTVRMERGDIWIVRWRGVREAVVRGECELI